jgi:acetolactate synthase-1/3 small subunit
MHQLTDQTYTLELIVRNRPGVLVRCAHIFGRRGHNIEALQVAALPDESGLSAMRITAHGNPATISQITAQLSKLVDVQNVTDKEQNP